MAMGPLDRVGTVGVSHRIICLLPPQLCGSYLHWLLIFQSQSTHIHTYFCHNYYKIPLAVYIFHIQLYLLPYAMTAL